MHALKMNILLGLLFYMNILNIVCLKLDIQDHCKSNYLLHLKPFYA